MSRTNTNIRNIVASSRASDRAKSQNRLPPMPSTGTQGTNSGYISTFTRSGASAAAAAMGGFVKGTNHLNSENGAIKAPRSFP